MATDISPTDFELSPELRALFAVPALPSITADTAGAFFAAAPASTVVEVYGELYKRSPSGRWTHLEDLTSSGGYYTSMEYEQSSPSEMTELASGSAAGARVVRIGE